MDISKMTLDQLKALAYDQMVELQKIQMNLKVIQEAIEQKKVINKEQNGTTESKDN